MTTRFSRLETMFNRIVLHSMDNPNAVGLLSGQTGILITIARYARITERESLETIADKLFENVTAKASQMRDISFAYGLSGICWGVEYLVQKGIMPDPANEIDLDTYSSTLACKICEALDADADSKKRMIASSRRLLRKKYSEITMVAEYASLIMNIIHNT